MFFESTDKIAVADLILQQKEKNEKLEQQDPQEEQKDALNFGDTSLMQKRKKFTFGFSIQIDDSNIKS
jgi:hypothetical protein